MAGILILIVALIAIPRLQSGAQEKDAPEKSEIIAEESEAVIQTENENSSSAARVDKTETVHVSAAADGTPEKITVEVMLKNDGNSQTITDYTTLKNIKNTEGDEEFTWETDGTLLWENHGEDISYEGTAEKDLPVSVHLTYYLDGQETEPKDLAGKSGHLKIHFSYENHTSKEIDVEGTKIAVKVPFIMLSALFLDDNIFQNVEVENGKMVEMDGQTVVVGYAFPGLAESLELADYEPAEDINIPEYVEISADVSDFALDFTATIASTGLFSDMDTDKLDDVDELTGAMEELNDASGELVDGMSSLFEGVSAFQGSMGEYRKAVKAVDKGVGGLKNALSAMNQQKSALQEGAKNLAESLREVNVQLQAFPADTNESFANDEDMQKAVAAAKALAEDAGKLLTVISALGDTMEQAENFAAEAENYQAQLMEGLSAAESELQAAKDALAAVSAEADVDEEQITVDLSSVEEAVRAAAKDAGLTEEAAAEVAAAVTKDRVDIQVEKDAASASVKGIENVSAYLDNAFTGLWELPVFSAPDITLDTEEISAVLADMQSQLEVLKKFADEIAGGEDSLKNLQDIAQKIKSAAAALAEGSSQLSDGVTAMAEGISGLYEGSVKLKEGTSALTDAASAINQGLSALKKGAGALKDGMKTFDEEGIQELSALAGDDLRNLIDRVKALKDADSSYNNYAGIAAGKRGEVRFIIETAGIEKED